MNQKLFLKIALEAAKKAEAVIMKYYGSVEASLKKDQTPVTLADIEAEAMIVETIKDAFPNHSILGEEAGNLKSESEFLWIIDPIDGTKNYIKKIFLFATQIALLKNNEFVLGVSNAPAIKELLYAEKGGGAYCNDEKINVSNISDLKNATLSFGGLNYFQKKGKTPNLLNLIDQVYRPRSYGEFWAWHLLAEGKIDIIIEAGSKIWDFAALKTIVEEAGGKITDMNGDPISLNTTSTTITNGIIATNGVLHNAALEFFRA